MRMMRRRRIYTSRRHCVLSSGRTPPHDGPSGLPYGPRRAQDGPMSVERLVLHPLRPMGLQSHPLLLSPKCPYSYIASNRSCVPSECLASLTSSVQGPCTLSPMGFASSAQGALHPQPPGLASYIYIYIYIYIYTDIVRYRWRGREIQIA